MNVLRAKIGIALLACLLGEASAQGQAKPILPAIQKEIQQTLKKNLFPKFVGSMGKIESSTDLLKVHPKIRLMNAKEHENWRAMHEDAPIGLGFCTLATPNGSSFISEVYHRSTAEAKGLKPGMKVVSIDGQDGDWSALLYGEQKRVVTLAGGSGKIEIHGSAYLGPWSKLIDGTQGKSLLYIQNFHRLLPAQMASWSARMKAPRPGQAYYLDLRVAQEGSTEMLAELAWLMGAKPGDVVARIDRGARIDTVRAKKAQPWKDTPKGEMEKARENWLKLASHIKGILILPTTHGAGGALALWASEHFKAPLIGFSMNEAGETTQSTKLSNGEYLLYPNGRWMGAKRELPAKVDKQENIAWASTLHGQEFARIMDYGKIH